MYEDLEVKKSTLPNAGKGLFTKREIKKGERFVEYLGEILNEKECDERAERDEYGYMFYISKNNCIDAYHTPEAYARYANDANGISKVKGLKNNCSYDIYKRRGWIKADKNIKAGEEIFVNYGAEYWKVIRYNIKLDKEREKEKSKKKK